MTFVKGIQCISEYGKGDEDSLYCCIGNGTFTAPPAAHGMTTPQLLIGDEDGVVPTSKEVRRAGSAVAWGLWALFAYSRDIGLKQPYFY